MRKTKTAGVLLLAGLLLFTAACGKRAQETSAKPGRKAASNETTTEEFIGKKTKQTQSYPDATDAELAALGEKYSGNSLLNACTDVFFQNEDPYFTADFTGEMTDEEIKNALFLGSRSPLYDFYFDKPEVVEFSAGKNPLDADATSTKSYVKYDGKKLDLLLGDLLDLKGVNAETLADADGGVTGFYYHDGALYLTETARIGSKAPYAAAEETTRLRDGRYRVTVRYALFENERMVELDGQGELIAGIVTVDGERHWAVFSYSAYLQRERQEVVTEADRGAADANASLGGVVNGTPANAYRLLGESGDAVVKAFGSDYRETSDASYVYDEEGLSFYTVGGKVTAVSVWSSAAVYNGVRSDMTAKELKALDRSVEIEESGNTAEATLIKDGYVFGFFWESYSGENDEAARVTISKQ